LFDLSVTRELEVPAAAPDERRISRSIEQTHPAIVSRRLSADLSNKGRGQLASASAW